MARTSSHWMGGLKPDSRANAYEPLIVQPTSGWFLFHSMHSLCGIVGSCRNLFTLTVYLPMESSAWSQSFFKSLVDVSCPDKRSCGSRPLTLAGWISSNT